MLIPNEFYLSNNKLYFIYKETGPPLESLGGDWGFKSCSDSWEVDEDVKKEIWLNVFCDALKVLDAMHSDR